MAKLIFLIACLISALGSSSSSTNFECTFHTGEWYVVGSIYLCTLNNNPMITTEESAQISGISASHVNSQSNNDVLGFQAYTKTIQYFPQRLGKFFNNLKAIHLQSCELKEIHQSDLKAFPNLVYFYLLHNSIQVVEEDLFEFNPNLDVVGFLETKIIHIDPNVFDHLNKLRYFLFSSVPCINQAIENSMEKVKEAIKIVKSNCVNSEISSWVENFKNLEIESKTLNPEAFEVKLESFEKSFKNSKFSKFRPINYKIEDLKSERCSNCRQLMKISALDTKVVDLGENLSNDLRKIENRFDDFKLSQCGMKDFFVEVNTSQINFGRSLGDLKVTQNLLISVENKIKEHEAVLSALQNSQDILKISQDETLRNLTMKLNELKKDIKTTQDETKLSISDIVATLSDHKSFQSDVKDMFIKIRTSQNEAKVSFNTKNSDLKDDIAAVGEKLGNVEGKFENLEGHFLDFNGELAEKYKKNEKDFENMRHKISIIFDKKIKGVEKRLMKKFEDILEEKLAKILDKKLGSILNGRSGLE